MLTFLLQHPDAVHARMKEFLSKEMTAIKQPHEERVEGIKREVDAKEAERRHVCFAKNATLFCG